MDLPGLSSSSSYFSDDLHFPNEVLNYWLPIYVSILPWVYILLLESMVQCSLNRISCINIAHNWESEIFYLFLKFSLFVQLSLFLSISMLGRDSSVFGSRIASLMALVSIINLEHEGSTILVHKQNTYASFVDLFAVLGTDVQFLHLNCCWI